MIEYNKKIKLDDYKSLSYSINSGYVQIHTITALDTKDNAYIIKLSRWDDYTFTSWYDVSFEEYEKLNKQTHKFEKEHPLYIPLLHLLNGEDELIIDDDETSEMNKKYMRIYYDKEDINIDFINNLEEDTSLEKFNVFIKNIGFDLRSKIDCLEKDTKERLFFFFKEVYARMLEEEHQIMIEEYLISNNLLTKEESKKYVKKLILNKRID